MQIIHLPIHATDDPSLKKIVTAWATAFQDRIKEKFGARFELQWTFWWTKSAEDPVISGYDEEIMVSEKGHPYARIVLFIRPEHPCTLTAEVDHKHTEFKLGSKVRIGISTT